MTHPFNRRQWPARRALSGHGVVLPVPQKRQQFPNSCVMCCCVMICAYHTGRMPGERELMDRYDVDCTHGTTYAAMQRVLSGELNAQFVTLRRATAPMLEEAFRAGHCVLAGVSVSGGSHALLITGLWSLETGEKKLVVNDPVIGTQLFARFATVVGALQDVVVVKV